MRRPTARDARLLRDLPAFLHRVYHLFRSIETGDLGRGRRSIIQNVQALESTCVEFLKTHQR